VTLRGGSRLERATLFAGVLLIALLTYYFPGHTYLHQDTQIYVPMFERIWDPSVLAKDLSATRPHTTFTIYDETALALRYLTGQSFRTVLIGEQFVFRAAGILGIYFIAVALGLEFLPALSVAAVCSLGAVITGPAVLAMEYEPTPRAFAMGLILLALGLAFRESWVQSSMAAGLGFLYHAPTSLVFLLLLLAWLIWKRNFRALIPLAAMLGILILAVVFQAGETEPHPFFTTLDPVLEQLQRMRASYNWVSLWGAGLIGQYVIFFALVMLALWRLTPARGVWFLGGLAVLGLLSIPLSYVLMEGLKWSLMAQVQPGRATLFITETALILAAVCGVRAGLAGGVFESGAWLFFVFLLPQQNRLWGDPQMLREVLVAAGLAAAAAALLRIRRQPLLPLFATLSFFLLPALGGVKNYPVVRTPSLDDLSTFARLHTPKDAVFLFPQALKGLAPGMFRADSYRCVYVDWKTGGQVNYFRDLGIEWWKRWRETMQSGVADPNPDRYRSLGIDFIVLKTGSELPGGTEVYRNAQYVVYATRKASTSAREGTDD
jgi:hypothetical protein